MSQIHKMRNAVSELSEIVSESYVLSPEEVADFRNGTIKECVDIVKNYFKAIIDEQIDVEAIDSVDYLLVYSRDIAERLEALKVGNSE